MRGRAVHLVGIGGIGMANFAVLLKESGYEVTGSDGEIYEPAISILRNAGITVRSPYDPSNLPPSGTPVIIGNAISRGNIELEAALDGRHRLYSFPEFMHDQILAFRFPIVVAGTHGKSSTTACLAHVLKETGNDPGYLIGAMPLDSPCGARLGKGDPFVIEGDEYDTAFFDKRSKFLHYFPRILILGPVEYDHADIFGNVEEMLLAYRRLLFLLPRNGALVYASDSSLTCSLIQYAPCPTISVGVESNASWRLLPDTRGLTFCDPSGRRTSCAFELPGQHNRMNALMAIVASLTYGANQQAILTALSSFRGIRRRLERKFHSNDLVVYDDFAHHPTAIRASIQAVRESYPGFQLIAVFEPRSNTMVRNVYQSELADALADADRPVVGTVHRADRIAADQRLDIDRLKSDIEKHGKSLMQVPNADIPSTLQCLLDSRPAVVLFMSNGSFGGVVSEFVKRLREMRPNRSN